MQFAMPLVNVWPEYGTRSVGAAKGAERKALGRVVEAVHAQPPLLEM